MAKCKVRIQLHKGTINSVVGALRNAAYRTMMDVQDDLVTSQRMPFDIGTMQNEETFVVMGYGKEIRATLMHGTPYARYQYYGLIRHGNGKDTPYTYYGDIQFNQAKNPNAQKKWLKPYLDGVFIEQAFANNLKKEGVHVIT